MKEHSSPKFACLESFRHLPNWRTLPSVESGVGLSSVERSRSRTFLDVLEARGLTLPEGGKGEPLRFPELVELLC